MNRTSSKEPFSKDGNKSKGQGAFGLVNDDFVKRICLKVAPNSGLKEASFTQQPTTGTELILSN